MTTEKNISKKHTYYLISTLNSQIDGWEVFGIGSKKEMKKLMLTIPFFQGTDIEADTYNKNAVVVSKTRAKKVYGIEDFSIKECNPFEKY